MLRQLFLLTGVVLFMCLRRVLCEQLSWWAPIPFHPHEPMSEIAICLTGTKRTLHGTWPRIQSKLMDSLSKIYGQQPDIYVLIQTVAEGNHTRHASSVYDPLPLDAEMQFLRQAMPGLVHADLVSSDSLSGECNFSPVSSHPCCQNGGKEKNEAAFGPWLSMFRARLCQERVLERSIQRGRPYDRVIRWRPDLALCDAVETLEWITRATPNCSAGFLRDYAWVVPYPILSEFNHFLGQRMLDRRCGTKHPDEDIKKAIVADKKRTFYPHTDTGATFVHSSSITFHFQDWNGNFAQLQRHAAKVGSCNGKDIWNTSDYANVTTSTNFDGETLLVVDGLFNRTVNFPTIRRQESRLQSAIEKQHKRVGKASSPGTVFSPQCTPLEEAKRKADLNRYAVKGENIWPRTPTPTAPPTTQPTSRAPPTTRPTSRAPIAVAGIMVAAAIGFALFKGVLQNATKPVKSAALEATNEVLVPMPIGSGAL